MTDSGQQGGALLDLPGYPLPHAQEGTRRLLHLRRADRFEVGNVLALAEAVGDAGETPQGSHLAVHDELSDQHQGAGADQHPGDEEICIRAEQPLVPNLHMQHAFGQLHLDDGKLVTLSRIDGEGVLQAA